MLNSGMRNHALYFGTVSAGSVGLEPCSGRRLLGLAGGSMGGVVGLSISVGRGFILYARTSGALCAGFVEGRRRGGDLCKACDEGNERQLWR